MDESEALQSIERGRRITRRLIGLQVALTALAVAVGVGAGERALPRMLRLVLTVVFAVTIYSGARWAAVGAGVLALLGAVTAFVASVAVFEYSVLLALALVALSTVALVVCVQFLSSPDVRAFQEFQRTGRVTGDADLADAFERKVEAAEQAEQDQQLLDEVRREEADEQQAQRERSRLRAEATEEERLASFERTGPGPWQLRERVLLAAAGLGAVSCIGLWAVALHVGGSQALLDPASVTPLTALVALVLVALGMSYGRFVALGLSLVLLVLGWLKYADTPQEAFPPWLHSFSIAHLAALALACGGLAWGVARDAGRTSRSDLSVRGLLGVLIGAVVAVVCGRPPLLGCGVERFVDAARLSSCHHFHGQPCAATPGCQATAGACKPRCEARGDEKTCASPCVLQDNACVYPQCELNGARCGSSAECGVSTTDGTCGNLCYRATDQVGCAVAGASCDWVECTGKPSKTCTEYSFDECPNNRVCSRDVY